MMSVTKKNKKPADTIKGFAEVEKRVGNYEKHPFFIKKAKDAEKFLKQAGLPKDAKQK